MKNINEIITEATKPSKDQKLAIGLSNVAKQLRKPADKLNKQKHPAEALVRKAIKALDDAAYDIVFPEK